MTTSTCYAYIEPPLCGQPSDLESLISYPSFTYACSRHPIYCVPIKQNILRI